MKTQRLVRIALFTVLTIIGGLIKIPIPGAGVMMTFQTFFVVCSGLILGAKDGFLSQLIYMVIGLVGVPIFTKGGGPWYIFEPSFGYIIGFSAGSFLTGLLRSKLKTLSVTKLFFCCLSGLSVVYLIGVPYQFFVLWLLIDGGTAAAAAMTLVTLPLMFVIDAVMLYLVCLIYPRLMTIIGSPKKTTIGGDGNVSAIKNPVKKTERKEK